MLQHAFRNRGGWLLVGLGIMSGLLPTRLVGDSLRPHPLASVALGGAADVKGLGTTADASESFQNRELRVHLPLPSSEVGATRIQAQAIGRHNLLSFEDADPDRVGVYEISAPITLTRRISESWMLHAGLTPSLAGDLEHLNAKSVRGSVTGMVIHDWPDDGHSLGVGVIYLPALGDNQVLPVARATWMPRPSVTLTAGVTYAPDTGRDRLTPALSVALRPTADTEIMLAYPRSWAAYRVRHDVTAYADFAPSGGRWRVGEAPGITDGGTIRLQGYRTGAGVGWDLGGLRLIAEGGAVWDREYSATPDVGEPLAANIGETWYVMLGIGR